MVIVSNAVQSYAKYFNEEMDEKYAMNSDLKEDQINLKVK
jgi:hypothetical protein